ncbi:MAG: class I SAM-dependent methyltransferase [Pseudomonadota bacterium]|nr:class I SAM-dependent methyltransferase [Pseudomonadota bacterium]
MKNFFKLIAPAIDVVALIFIFISALILKLYRRLGAKNLKLSTRLLKSIGIYPVRDHYYEPLFNDNKLRFDLATVRDLPGLNLNIKNQLSFLKNLNFQDNFEDFLNRQKNRNNVSRFDINNGSFKSGDAEFLFNFLRFIKPKRVIEVGCGASTKIISAALEANTAESGEQSKHVCIEPFERPWLEEFPNIELKREPVECVELGIFQDLQPNDLLFIDSSHMIRPQGDVVAEYLKIIPSLGSGVYVHVHDIFTPRDYLENWIRNKIVFWNEQYLLEALLTHNPTYEVIAALNFLKHEHYDELKKICPHLTHAREPGSFYFRTC